MMKLLSELDNVYSYFGYETNLLSVYKSSPHMIKICCKKAKFMIFYYKYIEEKGNYIHSERIINIIRSYSI